MDRKKEEEAEKTTTPLKTTEATNILTSSTATSNDDDTSTESSDNFESWTLVNDKEKTKQEKEDNRIEILKNSDHEEDDQEEEDEIKEAQSPDSLNDATTDDFSDGISIISESESVGRISPHPYLRDHLHVFNMKISLNDHMDDTILNRLRDEMEKEDATPLEIHQEAQEPKAEQQLRQRRRSSATNTPNQALQKASQTVAIPTNFPPFVKKGLQGIFYVGVGLAILALIGKIVHPTWQPLAPAGSSSDNSAELQQKVKYLSSIKDPQYQQKPGKYRDFSKESKESKTFKAWTGNGDSLKPVDITKHDLRKPYKCPDGSFVEIANMCMEKRDPNEPTIVDQFGQVVEDLKEQSEAFKTFEKVAEELQGFQDNPFEQLQDILGDQVGPAHTKLPYAKNKPIYQAAEDYKHKLPKGENYQKYPQQKGEETYTSKPYKQHNKEYIKSFGADDDSKPSKEFKKYHDHNSNFRDNSKEYREWKSDKFNNNSKERKYRSDNSKEHKNFEDSGENSHENHSKERFNRQKRKYDKKSNENDYSGEWQQKYMKHRAEQRKQNELKYQDNNKNWYIKRGDSRENKRSGEKQYR